MEIADTLFHGKSLAAQASHTIHLGTVREGARIIDEALFSLFKGPRSYTGEDVVEISCHGSTYIIQDSRNVGHFVDIVLGMRALERYGGHAKNIARHVIYLAENQDVRHMTPDYIEESLCITEED